MNVSTDAIRAIKPGAIEPFSCDAGKMFSIASTLSAIKRKGLPEGVVDYEHQKFFDRNIIIIHALKENDSYVLNQ